MNFETLMVHSEFIESLDAVRLISHSVRKSLALSDVARCNSMNSERTIILTILFKNVKSNIKNKTQSFPKFWVGRKGANKYFFLGLT